MPPERCLKCEWWNFSEAKCHRIFKARVVISQDAGEVLFETQPGVLPKHMEEELGVWLATAVQDLLDAWPGWAEVKRIRDGAEAQGCAGRKENKAIEPFLKVVKTSGEAQPLKNLDANGLFKSDISLW